MYAVEAEYIDKVVAQYGPATKIGSIVSGQTSVKQPEIEAFERHLPGDVHIISCHSMHGPNVNPKGQPLVIIKHRATQEKFNLVRNILSGFESNFVELSYQDHDRITADTQAVTHAAFLRYVHIVLNLSIITFPRYSFSFSMGAAWKANNQFPVSYFPTQQSIIAYNVSMLLSLQWLVPHFVGGIENVKVNVALRIYSNKWHVYAGTIFKVHELYFPASALTLATRFGHHESKCAYTNNTICKISSGLVQVDDTGKGRRISSTHPTSKSSELYSNLHT